MTAVWFGVNNLTLFVHTVSTSFTASDSSLISLLLISAFLIKSSSVSGSNKELKMKKDNK